MPRHKVTAQSAECGRTSSNIVIRSASTRLPLVGREWNTLLRETSSTLRFTIRNPGLCLFLNKCRRDVGT